jgi:hypothetical protein
MRTNTGKNSITTAIAIGVDVAQSGQRPPARYAAADAAGFAAALALPPDRIALLVDANATKTTIESRLRKLSVGPEDLIAVFFAGHAFAAGGGNYLVAHDTQSDDLIATAIPLRTIVDAIGQTRTVLFLDPKPLPESSPGIDEFSVDELIDLVDADRRLAFLSHGGGDPSHVSDVLKHGVWAHLLIRALTGQSIAALDPKHRLTARSLQRHLAEELPRTLREVLEKPAKQRPSLHGRNPSAWVLADLGPVLDARREAAGLTGQRLECVTLWGETRVRVKDLAGFQKTHSVPDRVRPATVRFVAAAARDDLQADLDAAFAAVREHLGYRRKDVTLTPPTDGAGTLRTPDFDYLVTVSLDNGAPADAIIRHEVTHLRSADVLRRPQFQKAFGAAFHVLSFEYAAPLDIAGLVDRLEAEPPMGIRVRCAADTAWCELDLNGFPGTVRVERNRLEIVGHRVGGATTLWAAFEAFQRLFNRPPAARSLPPAGR